VGVLEALAHGFVFADFPSTIGNVPGQQERFYILGSSRDQGSFYVFASQTIASRAIGLIQYFEEIQYIQRDSSI
jgi:hypothetical protein